MQKPKSANFFQLYRYICGETEIPEIYNFWCCLAVISAVLEDRVWFEHFRGMPIKPNMYICLVGPGSIGKGVALSRALDLMTHSTSTRYYRGSTTNAHLTDVLGKPQIDEHGNVVIPSPKLWLIMDELKNGVGSNPKLNEAFVAFMTELYTAGYIVNTGTRTHGDIAISNPCVSWTFGSNIRWLKEVLTSTIFDSGFIARTSFVFADYCLGKRITTPKYPEDVAVVEDHLKQRLWAMQHMEGRFLITPTAEAYVEKWYQSRPEPTQEMLFSIWKRQKEMLFRVAMVLCAADGKGQVIQYHHIKQATLVVKQMEMGAIRLLKYVAESREAKPINDTEEILKKYLYMKHTDLLRKMRSNFGLNAVTVKAAVEALEQEGVVVASRYKAGSQYGKLYTYVGYKGENCEGTWGD
jgi:hypothetical protein